METKATLISRFVSGGGVVIGGLAARRVSPFFLKKMVRKSKARGQLKGHSYTEGELNKLIDAVFHTLVRLNPEFLIIDGILHSLIEQDPTQSVLKFLHYNAPKLLAQYRRQVKTRLKWRRKNTVWHSRLCPLL